MDRRCSKCGRSIVQDRRVRYCRRCSPRTRLGPQPLERRARKLAVGVADEIRRLRADWIAANPGASVKGSPVSIVELSRAFGVSRQRIWQILQNQ